MAKDNVIYNAMYMSPVVVIEKEFKNGKMSLKWGYPKKRPEYQWIHSEKDIAVQGNEQLENLIIALRDQREKLDMIIERLEMEVAVNEL